MNTKIITEYKIGGGMSTNKAKIYMTYTTVNALYTGYMYLTYKKIPLTKRVTSWHAQFVRNLTSTVHAVFSMWSHLSTIGSCNSSYTGKVSAQPYYREIKVVNTKPPNKGQPPNNGQRPMYQLVRYSEVLL